MNQKIGIEGIRLFAHHGYYEVERLTGREFVLDVYIVFNPFEGPIHDELVDTVNYEEILNICTLEMAQTSKLLEPVAARICQRIKLLSNLVLTVTVRISKQFPVLPVQIDRFFVEITL